MDFNFTTEIDFEESTVEFLVQVENYTPGRIAPACQDPSSPAYSDPGDPAEFEMYSIKIPVVLKDQFGIKNFYFIPVPEQLQEAIEDKIVEAIFAKGEELAVKSLY